jgi:hypothetical protein
VTINESVIQGVLMRYAMDEKNHVLTIPNSTVLYRWEADLISVTSAGLAHEYEVKISLADYRRDFDKKWKHMSLKDQLWQGPNYFWYVTHGFDIDPPEYAGWIDIVCSTRSGLLLAEVRKQAPRLHTRKVTDKQQATIGRLLAYRLKNMYRTVYVEEWCKNNRRPRD